MNFTSTHASKSVVINVLRLFVKPVVCQLAFFVLLFVLLNAPDIFALAVFHSFVPLFKASSGFLFCYLLALLAVVLPSSFRKFYKIALLSVSIILFIVDVYLLLLYGDTLGTISTDAIAAILATNSSESVEYLSTVITADRLLIIAILLSVIFVLFFCLRKIHFLWNDFFMCALTLLLLAFSVITLKSFDRLKESNFYYLLTKDCPDLSEYKQNPTVLCDGTSVENIVLVIGESFSKFHSSLYGYEKNTNPLLEKLGSDSTLLVYENITSACVTTIPSIKSIMMAYTDAIKDSIEWYRCLTLIEVMSNVGYKNYWFSNQSKTGIYDNEVGRFADLCDEQFFIGDKYSGIDRNNKDGELLPLMENNLSDSTLSKFIIVQMMGSHTAFNMRYPESFDIFDNEDYNITHPGLSRVNRQLLAEYDNSILYNDYVLNELFQLFVNKDAIVFYFSDHGIDVFNTSNDYIGHAKANTVSVNVAKQIPFMVYTSPLFREKHPELQWRIKNAVNRPYSTDSIMYTIMDIAGVETVNGVSYKHKSLFK